MNELDPLKRAQIISLLTDISKRLEKPLYERNDRLDDAQTLKTIVAKL